MRGERRSRAGGVNVIRAWRLPLLVLWLVLWLVASSQLAAAQTPQRSADAQPPDTMAARTLACAPCHGAQGEGTKDVYFPRLAGKPAGYLYNQLAAFKDGRRHYPPMNYLLAYLSDQYLKEMADHFASQHPPQETPAMPDVSQDVLRHGQSIATAGVTERQVPACASCHGVQFTGMEPGIPGLLGLRAAYISAQLGAFRYGTRSALDPDCMQQVAARLTEDDVKAVAAFLASLPGSPSAVPAKQGSWPLPFACGSEAQ
jgi:cytochrome c553